MIIKTNEAVKVDKWGNKFAGWWLFTFNVENLP